MQTACRHFMCKHGTAEFSVTAFAEEAVSEVKEESLDDSVTESEGTETENVSVSEESAMVSEDSIETPAEQPTEETEEATKDENTEEDAIVGEEERQFEDVDIAFYGFRALIKNAGIKIFDDEPHYRWYLKEYKGEELICSYLLINVYIDQDGYLRDNNEYVNLADGVDRVELVAEIGDEGNYRTFSSGPVSRTNPVTDLEFSVNDVSTGAGSLEFNLSYAGALKLDESDEVGATVILHYGTDADEKTWTRSYKSTSFSNKEKTRNIVFTDLPVNTTLHGKLEVKVGEVNDWGMGECYYAYEIELPLADFTTKKDIEYKCAEVFPDEVLRTAILERVDAKGDTIKQSQLETITYLEVDRNSVSSVAIKDLTGIDLLTNVTNLCFENQEISDVTKINWGNLKKLKDLELIANNMEAIPDLTKNVNLKNVDLSENLLVKSECSKILEKLPPNYQGDFDISNQRTDGFYMIVEPTYYRYGDKTPLAIKLRGFKSGLDYTMKFFVDSNELSMESEYNHKYINKNTGLSLGKHAIRAELWETRSLQRLLQ